MADLSEGVWRVETGETEKEAALYSIITTPVSLVRLYDGEGCVREGRGDVSSLKVDMQSGRNRWLYISEPYMIDDDSTFEEPRLWSNKSWKWKKASTIQSR